MAATPERTYRAAVHCLIKFDEPTRNIYDRIRAVLPYPGLSKNSYNLGLWYDNEAFNARLAYAYRDKYYTGANDVSGNPNFNDKTGYLDAKFQWKATKNMTSEKMNIIMP